MSPRVRVPVVIGRDNCYTLHSHPSVNHRLCASASPSSSTGLSISDLTRNCRIGCESCYISSDSAIGSPIRLYTAPQEMLSTIIAPCLSPVLQLPAPPPFAMYTLLTILEAPPMPPLICVMKNLGRSSSLKLRSLRFILMVLFWGVLNQALNFNAPFDYGCILSFASRCEGFTSPCLCLIVFSSRLPC